MNEKALQYLLEQDFFSALDIHFARFMERLSGDGNGALFLAAALVSRATMEGHVCLDLTSLEGQVLALAEPGGPDLSCPEPAEWRKTLRASSVVGRPGDFKPLILDDHCRLYLHRYWEYENSLARDLTMRAAQGQETVPVPSLKGALSGLFGPEPEDDPDYQQVAAITCLTKGVCAISGGPGTGKSTLMSRILYLLLAQQGGEGLRIALTAPTGKAAARLQEATERGKAALSGKAALLAAIPTQAVTLHRLLGPVQGSPDFRHNRENPLPLDLIVVDEASMVDLALMSKLVAATPVRSRIILLGDKDQLASVEAGAVLGDICDGERISRFSSTFSENYERFTGRSFRGAVAEGPLPPIQDCVVQLRKSYRFGPESGIGRVSRAVNQGDGPGALGLLKGGRCDDISWHDLPAPLMLYRELGDRIVQGYVPYLQAPDPAEAFRHMERFRILCAIRQGPYGVAALNQLAERVLKEAHLIDPEARWYPGRPVLITRNDYNVGLFNGDAGLILPDAGAGNELRAFFQSRDGTLRTVLPARLPAHETLFAMTVHKSQGSEFDEVVLILPDSPSPVLTRELIYTAITRARQRAALWAGEALFLQAVAARIKRSSGLQDALWGEA